MTMAYMPKLNHIAGACALLFVINHAIAQSETQLSPVVVTGEKGTGYIAKRAMIGGPGGTEEVELKDVPASINVLTKDLLDDRQVKLISEAARTDASIGDYYATLGYYENLSIRGFPLDLATSFRMNGMALTGEQNFAFENKDRVEILKGVSAMQVGASSPGGVINFVTKRPKDVMSATVGTGERGTAYAAVDYGTFLNQEKSLGIRINAAHEDIRPYVKGAEGKRDFASLALDAKISNKTLVQFDLEYQNRSQKGVSGLMLLGNLIDGSDRRVPTGIPADIQLNRYNWVLPTEIKALNTGLKIDHEIDQNSSLFFHLSRSEVKINDRQAYPLPSADSNGGTFSLDGDFAVMDFRSENELRRNDQVQIGLNSKLKTGSIEHNLKYGISFLQRSIYQGLAAFNTAAVEDNIYSLNANVASNTGPIGPQNKTLDHYQNSLFIQDNIKLNDKLNLYLSSRFIELSDKSYSTSGILVGQLKKNYLLPSIGATYKLSSQITNYISYSEGVESGTRPIESSYRNTTPLKPRKTNQIEVGTKYTPTIDALITASIFRANRPNEYVDQSTYSSSDWKYDQITQDGKTVHTGIELSYAQKFTKRLNLTASTIYLKAKQEGASLSSMNGAQAIGIPNWRAVVFADYLIPDIENLSIQGGWTYVSSKGVTLDNSIKVPGYHKFDAGLKYVDKVGKSKATYRLNVENLFDKFYWRDVSQTYGSNTLYPGTPRIFRATATFDF
jgi:iron complex outermembrane receptor protein